MFVVKHAFEGADAEEGGGSAEEQCCRDVPGAFAEDGHACFVYGEDLAERCA